MNGPGWNPAVEPTFEDPPALARDHLLEEGARESEERDDVHLDHLQLAVQVDLREGPAGAEARVVHQEPDLVSRPPHSVATSPGPPRAAQVGGVHGPLPPAPPPQPLGSPINPPPPAPHE